MVGAEKSNMAFQQVNFCRQVTKKFSVSFESAKRIPAANTYAFCVQVLDLIVVDVL